MKKIILAICISVFYLYSFSQEVLSVEKIETITTQTKYPFGMGTASNKKNAERMAIEELKVQLMEQLENQIKVDEMLKHAKTGIISSKGFYEIIAYIEDGTIITTVTTVTTTTESVKPETTIETISAKVPKITTLELNEEPATIKSEPKTEPTIRPTSIIEDLLNSESEETLNQKLSNYSSKGAVTYTDKLHFVKDVLEQRYIVVIQNNKIIAFLSTYNNSRFDYISKTQISDIKQKYYDNPENKFIYINILKNN